MLTACPLCGKQAEQLEIQGIKLTGCDCVGERAVMYQRCKPSEFTAFNELDERQLRHLTQPSVYVAAEVPAPKVAGLEHKHVTCVSATSTPSPKLTGLEQWLPERPWFGETRHRSMTNFTAPMPPVSPLDVKYDGVTLRDLLIDDERARRHEGTHPRFTPAQRAAVSAHWSAELRARVAAAKAKERERVVLDLDAEDM